MKWMTEFKQFAMRGNVIDLAVAVVIGAAFGKIVASLVDGIVMPLIGLLIGGVDIAGKSLTLGHAVIKWGMFLQSVVDFTIIAFSIFVAIKLVNLLQSEKNLLSPPVPKQEALLTEIRDLLKRQSEK
jgi:large conductance mechanosensitive channel